ncbi:putative acyl-activating enzyme 16, chloroplastic [Porphyridium purpureum]|uniref:Putative acyl-activating enzyme 16, chloroplastic n=1 Tax=Porphyridium purpureum TaxID=35688 RepID=A0A5J4YJZ8_PORPP|nr:putative acyl-activating enzyme 16, chloroplastic [Porphyridium purpureum]|eukprot:POR3828..scf289_17
MVRDEECRAWRVESSRAKHERPAHVALNGTCEKVGGVANSGCGYVGSPNVVAALAARETGGNVAGGVNRKRKRALVLQRQARRPNGQHQRHAAASAHIAMKAVASGERAGTQVHATDAAAGSFPVPQPHDTRYPCPSPIPETADMQQLIAKCESLPELWLLAERQFGSRTAIIDPYCPSGNTTLTFAELAAQIRAFSAGLRQLGLRRKETVSLFSENSHRWLIADQAVQMAGASSAVRGVAAPAPEIQYIYEHSESVGVICETKAVLMRFLESFTGSLGFAIIQYGALPTKEELAATKVARFDSSKLFSFEQVLANGEQAEAAAQEKKGSTGSTSAFAPAKEDCATLIYTSGTTGLPKGVVLSHGNLLHQTLYLSIGTVDTVPGDVFVSILPCWHIFERTAEYFVLSRGGTLVYSNTRKFREDLVAFQPHILVGVPRVLELLYSSVMQKVEKAKKLQRLMFNTFVALSILHIKLRRIATGKCISASPTNYAQRLAAALAVFLTLPLYALAGALVWKKIRAGLGGRVKEVICGGGSLNMGLENFFEAAQINIFVGYGLTETSPVITNRHAEHCVRGTAGLTPAGVEVRVVDPETFQPVQAGLQKEGLITCRGPSVTSGYFKNDEANAKAFDADGFFNTGDLGYVSAQGDLVITGRLKDIIVLSNGENLAPAPVEDAILESSVVDQVVLVGQDERFLGALVVPNLDVLAANELISAEQVAEIESLRGAAHHDRARVRKMEDALLHGNPALEAYMKKELSRTVMQRKNFIPMERVQRFRLVLTPFTVENGMMTQTLKIKRDVVFKSFATEIDALFK